MSGLELFIIVLQFIVKFSFVCCSEGSGCVVESDHRAWAVSREPAARAERVLVVQ